MRREEDKRRREEDARRREEDERRRQEDERREEDDRRRRQEVDVLNVGGLNIGNPQPVQDPIWVKGRSIAELKMKMNIIKEEDAKKDAAKAKAAGKKVEEAVAAEELVQQANTRFSLEFGGFLATFKKEDSEDFQYPAQIETMKRLNSYVLNVDFLNILSDKKYKSLAIRLGESTEYLWLHRVIAEFLIANGMDNEDVTVLTQKVPLSFTNLHSLKALKAHMRSKPCWKTTKNNEKTVTAHGRKSFSLLISDVLNKNKENISYNGKFNEDDILLGETFCWIYSQQLENQPTQLCCRSQLHLDCHGTFL
ncbi:hypothetical protein VPH35_079044 [Triticum aestivum]|uniref:uncharacterized protein n=1 Tax=Triticum aestivum TaxID=4565 RepID=UPI001D022C7A|nr:uncharacterized protein LOC123098265 [Triticum aestivum]